MNADLMKKLMKEAETLRKDVPPAKEIKADKPVDKLLLNAAVLQEKAVQKMDNPADLSDYYRSAVERMFWHYIRVHGFSFFASRSGKVIRHIADNYEEVIVKELLGGFDPLLANSEYITDIVTELVSPFGFVTGTGRNGIYWTSRTSVKKAVDIPV